VYFSNDFYNFSYRRVDYGNFLKNFKVNFLFDKNLLDAKFAKHELEIFKYFMKKKLLLVKNENSKFFDKFIKILAFLNPEYVENNSLEDLFPVKKKYGNLYKSNFHINFRKFKKIYNLYTKVLIEIKKKN